jgi:hypothetical protein
VFDPFTPVLSDLFSFGQGVLRRDLSLLLERPVGAPIPGAAGHILFLARLRFEHLFRALQLIIAEAMLRGALDVVCWSGPPVKISVGKSRTRNARFLFLKARGYFFGRFFSRRSSSRSIAFHFLIPVGHR